MAGSRKADLETYVDTFVTRMRVGLVQHTEDAAPPPAADPVAPVEAAAPVDPAPEADPRP